MTSALFKWLAAIAIAACVQLDAVGFAQSNVQANAAEFQRIISTQIRAFGADDGQRAFSFASPGIRRKFKTVENFMAMVKSGYSPVYRPRSVKFGAVTREFAGRPTQRVVLVDQRGRIWIALYAFEQQADGSWRIDGVSFAQSKPENA